MSMHYFETSWCKATMYGDTNFMWTVFERTVSTGFRETWTFRNSQLCRLQKLP